MRDDRPHFATGLALAALAVFVAWGAWVLTSTDEVGAAAPETEREALDSQASDRDVSASAGHSGADASAPDSTGGSPSRRDSDPDGAAGDPPVPTTGSIVVRLRDERTGTPIDLPYVIFALAARSPDIDRSSDRTWSAVSVDGEATIGGLPLDEAFVLVADPGGRNHSSALASSIPSSPSTEMQILPVGVVGLSRKRPTFEVSHSVRIERPWIRLRVTRADGGALQARVLVRIRGRERAPLERWIAPDADGRVTFSLSASYVGEDIVLVAHESESPSSLLSHRIRLDDLQVGPTQELSCTLHHPDILVEGVFDLSEWIVEPDSGVSAQRPWLVVQRRFGEGAWQQCTRVVLEDGGAFRLYGLHDEGASYRVAPILRSGVLEDQAVPFEPYTRGLLVRVRPPESVPR